MRTSKSLLLVVSMLSAFTVSAAQINIFDAFFDPLVGKRVVAEGLAWGAEPKDIGPRLVLPSGVSLVFTGSRYSKLHRNGRTVQVVGKLGVQHTKSTTGTGYYSEPTKYYTLKVESLEVIDEVKLEYPQLAKK